MKKQILFLITFSLLAFFAYGQNIEVPAVKKPTNTTTTSKPATNPKPAKTTTKQVNNKTTNKQKTPTKKQPAKPKPVGTNGQWVDLGLPSGLLWCDRNLGASSPEDYGYYFAWGETSIKKIYDWSTYRYFNGNYHDLTKYSTGSYYGNRGFTDGLARLQSGDDAATYHKGSGARMPTKDEWQELLDNTTNKWTTRNGVNGRLFKSKKNGNSIFLPAAGYRGGGSLSSVGGLGSYWSSSLDTGSPNYAWGLFFGSDYVYVSDNYRYCGTSVRPVREHEPEINPKAVYPGTRKTNQQGGSPGYAGTPDQGGTGWSLKGRTAKALPEPRYDSPQEGKVIVKIWVDRNGNVVKAETSSKECTDENLKSQAEQAALKSKFSPDPNATELQTGTITYFFKK